MNMHTQNTRMRKVCPRIRVWGFRILVVFACIILAYYCAWWFRVRSLWLYVMLLPAAFGTLIQLPAQWLLYLRAERRQELAVEPSELTVDVFVTAYHEPESLIEATLTAACEIRGPHKTWLLDDGNRPALQSLAQRLGAGYLTRSSHQDAKAGNVNAALERTDGEIILILDIDHRPAPGILERTLGVFSDPNAGFVQTMLTFRNAQESWIARAAIESSLDFYNPTSFGIDDAHSTTMMGSNSLIRRSALESIGGYQPGLAEDLATSIGLHSAGWRSVYVAEPLAPGLAPVDTAGWFIQQLKWSRGVFEELLTRYPKVLRQLTSAQRFVYLLRMTSYWLGWVAALTLLVSLLVAFAGSPNDRLAFADYVTRFLLLLIISSFIRGFALSTWHHPSVPTGTLWRGAALIYGTWPVYTLAWLLVITRMPLAFRPTPKGTSGTLKSLWMLPQIASVVLLIGASISLIARVDSTSPFLLVILIGQMVANTIPLAPLLQEVLNRRQSPARRPAPAGAAKDDVAYDVD